MARGTRRSTLILGVILLAALGVADGAEPLRIRVTPAMAFAPGFVKVQASIEANAENRILEVVASSQDFYRSSEVEIDGEKAPRLNVFTFPNLPAGDYEFTAVLIGTRGPRAQTSQPVRVMRSASGR